MDLISACDRRKMDEPKNHPIFLILLAVVALGTVPFLFVGSDPTFLFGIPLWLWSSILFTVALSAVTAFGIMFFWKDRDLD